MSRRTDFLTATLSTRDRIKNPPLSPCPGIDLRQDLAAALFCSTTAQLPRYKPPACGRSQLNAVCHTRKGRPAGLWLHRLVTRISKRPLLIGLQRADELADCTNRFPIHGMVHVFDEGSSGGYGGLRYASRE